ncbi:GFA family protein [Baekduia soli]|uniref:GFA family protein n=1 Tax=Baekduia soli TaxID=496014 RepID=A0A5B8TZL4_9ACTN|nr:GFA family protein [Baekduia soli]QEC46168.1 GFA family protein [Baekduia soli]
MSRREARCRCGQLQAFVEGEPKRVSICHCLSCQRRTGSAFGEQARFSRVGFSHSGEFREWERVSDDGQPRSYWFCPICGSTVWYATDEGEVAIPVGALADPTFPPPTRSVWERRKHAWVHPPAAADRHD